MFSNTTISLLLIIFMCIVTRKIHSLKYAEGELTDEDVLWRSGFEPFIVDERASMKRTAYSQTPSFLKNRPLTSSGKYFDSIRKIRNSLDNVRDKRFWLFAKKDEQESVDDLTPLVKASPNSLTQGLWRSGIVGRRR